MKNIRIILKRLFAIFLCTGIISCSAYGKYTVAYAAGEELAAGLIGYIPFSTAFFSAAAALGVTGASLAGVLSQENGNADLTAAQKAAESAIAKQSGLKTLYNGVNVVKSYVSDKVNYFSSAFMAAVAEALNDRGLLANKEASYSATSTEALRTVNANNFLSLETALSSMKKYESSSERVLDYAISVCDSFLPSGLTAANIVVSSFKSNSLNFAISAFDSSTVFKNVSFNIGANSIVSQASVLDDSQTKLFQVYVDISEYPYSYKVTDVTDSFFAGIGDLNGYSLYDWTHSGNGGGYSMMSYLQKFANYGYSIYYSVPLIYDTLHYKPYGTAWGLYNAFTFSPAWSVTSNLPKFGASALLESMPTWAGATTTIPANTVDSVATGQVAYPVTIPAGSKALTDGLTADDLQDLTQDQAQAGSIDTTTDITDLSAVTQAITGAADQTAANFDTLFGWLDHILSAIKAIPAAIADAISSAFAFQQSSLDGLMLPTEITKKFPFCIPFDIADCLRLFQTDEREAPHYEYTLKYADQANTIVIDLSQFDDIAKLVRSLEFIGFLVGLAFATRYLIRG